MMEGKGEDRRGVAEDDGTNSEQRSAGAQFGRNNNCIILYLIANSGQRELDTGISNKQ